MSSLKEKLLFGGALSCFIPKNSQDASMIRDIPDNQEVFLHASNEQSIMIDIVEYQAVEGEESARYYFEDLASLNDSSENKVLCVEKIHKEDTCMKLHSEAWALSGQQYATKFNENTKNLIEIDLLLYRLPQFSTDILVIMNSPLCVQTSTIDIWTKDIFKQMACSLNIIDSTIFV
ncbi:ran guanine nucleotide release factor isoform X3 [Hydra vulgaris]|uniref:Ran guanine nucleotide release factor isoform X3 n=1 Tax=Hydra vulgaris TaxID=6087 RepID=A0ABM4C3A9_HYDVU